MVSSNYDQVQSSICYIIKITTETKAEKINLYLK